MACHEEFLTRHEEFLSRHEEFMTHQERCLTRQELFVSHQELFLTHHEEFLSHQELFLTRQESFPVHPKPRVGAPGRFSYLDVPSRSALPNARAARPPQGDQNTKRPARANSSRKNPPRSLDSAARCVSLAIGWLSAPTQRQPDRSGAALVFERGAGGTWTQKAQFLPEAWQIDFGHQVGMGAEDLAVGASRTQVAGEEHGSVSVFDLDCLLCPPDLDLDGTLTVFDFLTFLNLFQDGDPLADFDGDGELTIFDFLAFQTAFEAGCA